MTSPRPSSPPQALNSQPSLISLPQAGPDTEEIDYDDEKGYTSNNPRSAFYSHPPTRTSLEIRKSESRVHVAITSPPSSSSNVNLSKPPPLPTHPPTSSSHLRNGSDGKEEEQGEEDDDLESGKEHARGSTRLQIFQTLNKKKQSAGSGASKPCRHKQRTRQRSRQNLTGTIRGSRACAPYRRLSRHQKWAVQILLALLVVGLGVGLGVGISRAVGAGVWRSDNSSYEIPPEGGRKESG